MKHPDTVGSVLNISGSEEDQGATAATKLVLRLKPCERFLKTHVKTVDNSKVIPEYIDVYARIVNSMGLLLDLKGPKNPFWGSSGTPLEP